MASEVTPVSTGNPLRVVNLAREELLKGLREAEQQVKTFKEILSRLDEVEQRSNFNLSHLPPVRQNEYRGMRAMDALESYLRARRGFKVPLKRAVEDLLEGGVDPGRSRGKQTEPSALISHTLKIGIPNRRSTVAYQPDSVSAKTGAHVIPRGVPDDQIILWLAETADEPRRRTRKD